ncbi:hypothetical protein F5Y18DRAFT_431115 [Xylariaceae sp. FL1019]|nr:hypothetical protein F5Y18DRAFT_431115 [Xylariaceae sp. FL1019]
MTVMQLLNSSGTGRRRSSRIKDLQDAAASVPNTPVNFAESQPEHKDHTIRLKVQKSADITKYKNTVLLLRNLHLLLGSLPSSSLWCGVSLPNNGRFARLEAVSESPLGAMAESPYKSVFGSPVSPRYDRCSSCQGFGGPIHRRRFLKTNRRGD